MVCLHINTDGSQQEVPGFCVLFTSSLCIETHFLYLVCVLILLEQLKILQ